MNDFSIGIILIYFASMIAVILVRYISRKIGNFIAAIGSISAFTMAALRPNDFPDYKEYVVIFEHASSGDFENSAYWATHSEPGFKIISYLISLTGFDYLGLMIFMAALSFSLLVITSRIANIRFAYLWFAYLSIYFITRDLGAIRLAIASHLIVISVLQRDFLRKLIPGVIASFTFQYFSIIAPAATFLSRIKPSINILFFLIASSFILGWAIRFENILHFIPDKQMENYGGTVHVMPGFNVVALPFLRNIFYTIVLYWFMRKKLESQEYKSWIWLAFLSSISYIAFSGILVMAYRFSAYFGAIFPLAFAFLLNQSDSSNQKFAFIFLILVFSFFIGFYMNNFVWMIGY